jgi:transposase-like protein
MMSNTANSNTRRSRSAWEQLMAQYEAGDLSQRIFCEQHGLAYSTFCYWRKQLRQSASIENHSEHLLELPMLPVDESPDWRIELDLGKGMVLRLK